MRIVFICGSLEPGKDGVGDYTRRLAGECIQQRVECTIIALNDKHQSESEAVKVSQSSEDQILEVLRLPQTLPWSKRIQVAGDHIQQFNPDWLSLQYVPYSFQKKGLPLRLAKRLNQLGGNRRWHIMFHELWENGTGWKNQIVGTGQKWIAGNLAQILGAFRIHSSTYHNVNLLKSIGLRAIRLPLFGNIPVCQKGNPHSILSQDPDGRGLKGMYFGAAPSPQRVPAIIKGLDDIMRNSSGGLKLVLAGSLGIHRESFIESIKQLDSRKITVSETGFIGENELSQLMYACDFGISRSPAHHLGKSGSLISMIEHGLPVWCPHIALDQAYKNDFNNCENSLIFSSSRIPHFIRKPPQSRLSAVAQQFWNEL